MTNSDKTLTTALIISSALITLNIIAVTQGSADIFYNQVEQFLGTLLK